MLMLSDVTPTEYRYTESGSCRVSPLFMVMLRCDAEYCYAECRPFYCYAECRYPECHGAQKISCFAFQKKKNDRFHIDSVLI